ncbi:hypothetical protein O6H91_22G051800 [Diphasiastrum complanatum]|uniref:Uncharacterized protein n=1 Tax=Diphasiastrum complanatum TaxID=34168 RepID=A0ACC2AFH5_DIPCM|nr:hypothetical protein O6H91_22G051800 [Diphasiastrum complanatum]
MSEVDVELYIQGRGPQHTFKASLEGWDQNRLDLEQIMNEYRLKAVYAFSIGSGRGQRLMYNPRNGLSVVPYSGKPGSLIRLDGDPKGSLMVPILKISLAAFLISILTMAFALKEPPKFFSKLQVLAGGGGMIWLVCLVTMFVTQLTRHNRQSK